MAPLVRDNLLRMGSATRCHFVNPRYEEAWGSPCYPSLEALPEVPESVLVAVNPLRAASVVAAAAAAGARAVVIPGGGVVEGGDAAARMQAEVREIALAHGLVLLGPNCMGVIDLVANSATYIGDVSPWLARGHVAAIAQSGSATDAFVHSGTRIGFSRIVSCGSEAVLDVTDYLAWFLDDPETHAILLFVEGFRRPERFLALADRALAEGKPILAVKVGRSPQAQAAAIAHSGALAGEERVTDAAFRAAGVVRCADLDELFEAAELHAGCDRLGRAAGRGRSGVITVSTGEASLIADLAGEVGADLPPVPEPARAEILEALPTLGYLGNPFDPWGAAETEHCYRTAFETFATSGAYDVLVAVHDFPYRSLANEVDTLLLMVRQLVAATRERPGLLPAFVSLTSGEPTPEIAAALAEAGGIPLLRGAREALAAIAGRAWWERRRAERLARGPARPTWPALAGRGRPDDGERDPWTRVPARYVLPERESLALLAAAGVPVVAHRAVADAQGAVAAARELGHPVALKADAPGLAHKSDAGAVRLGLVDDAAVSKAFTAVTGAALAAGEGGAAVRGALVAAMAPPGVELIVGMRRDPLYGPAVLVGLGGVLAELLDDVAVALAPLGERDALALLERLRGAPLLRGFRSTPAVDLAAVARAAAAVSRLGWERPEILEIDLNPLIAGPDGAVAVDALVVLADA